jgi:photosystem II stability/assembly factor-like uncharacterized protein
VDLEDELVLALDPYETVEPAAPISVSLPRVIATARSGSTIVCLVDAKPPLLVSHDAGTTWRESGRGLPPGRALAISDEDPDIVLFAAQDRLYVSRDGGRFWRALAVELDGIEAVELDTSP